MKTSSISERRTPLSAPERERFERYMAEIFGGLGMDLNSEPCKRTPHRWVQGLVDMTEGYNGDPNIEVAFERECVNCAEDIAQIRATVHGAGAHRAGSRERTRADHRATWRYRSSA